MTSVSIGALTYREWKRAMAKLHHEYPCILFVVRNSRGLCAMSLMGTPWPEACNARNDNAERA